MKKIILSILIPCSIFNIINSMETDENNNNNNNISRNNNNNNNEKYVVTAKDTWYEIAAYLINIKNLETAKTITEREKKLSDIIETLRNFALISKKHYQAIKFLINNYKFEINDKKISLKEYYIQNKILRNIKNELNKNIPSQSFEWLIDVNSKEEDSGMTALMFAASTGNIEPLKLLIQNGANVNEQDNENWTPLMFAAVSNQKEICKILIQNGANLSMQKLYCNDTALSLACYWGFKEIVELLIENGAIINDGAIKNAYERGHKKLGDYLKKIRN